MQVGNKNERQVDSKVVLNPRKRKWLKVSNPQSRLLRLVDQVQAILDTFPMASLSQEYTPAMNNLPRLQSFQKRLQFHTERLEKRIAPLIKRVKISVEDLCQLEPYFLTLLPIHTIPSLGAALMNLGVLRGPHNGGQDILQWNARRKRANLPETHVPMSLKRTTLTHLLVGALYYDGIMDSFTLHTEITDIPLLGIPWLVGYLYSQQGILWMIFVALCLGELRSADAPFSINDVYEWVLYAFLGYADFPAPHLPIQELKTAILACEQPTLLESKTDQVIMHTLTFLPTVMVTEIIRYHGPEWIHKYTTMKESSTVILCHIQVLGGPGEQEAKEMAFYMNQVLPAISAIPNTQLCKFESFFIKPKYKGLPRFGAILSHFATQNARNNDDHGFDEMLGWRKQRSTYPDIDPCIPDLLEVASLTALLCYYTNYHGTLDIRTMAVAIPWLTGYLYGENGIHWMLFVVRHIQATHRNTGTFKDLSNWLRLGLCGHRYQPSKVQIVLPFPTICGLSDVVQSFVKQK